MNPRPVVLVLFGAAAFAQSSSLTLAASQEGAPAARTPQDIPVIRVGIDLIQFDASVTDKAGRPVTGLKAEDFTIEIDGKKQAVDNAMFFGGGSSPMVEPGSAAELAASAPLPDRTLVFLVDDLNISFTSMYSARRAMQKFAAGWDAAEARIGVRRTSDEGEIIRLSRSSERFAEAVAGIRYNNRSSMGGSSAPDFAEVSSRGDISPPSFTNPAIERANLQQRIYSLLTTVNSLRSVPGRKAVVFVSEGFSLMGDRGGRNQLGVNSPFDSLFGDDNDVDAALRMITEVANRASVVVYTIDPSGLVSDAPGADVAQAPSMSTRRAFTLDRWDSQGTLQRLAADTGGLSVFNHNDLRGGLNDVVTDQRSYYLIGFEPPPSAFAKSSGKPKFHSVKLTVNRPGVRVRTRAGFYGVTDQEVIARAPLRASPEF